MGQVVRKLGEGVGGYNIINNVCILLLMSESPLKQYKYLNLHSLTEINDKIKVVIRALPELQDQVYKEFQYRNNNS